jgi:hypothetical protein
MRQERERVRRLPYPGEFERERREWVEKRRQEENLGDQQPFVPSALAWRPKGPGIPKSP